MSRRFEELEERARQALLSAKEAVKRLGEGDRARLLAWLCAYFSDRGELLGRDPSRRRRRISLDGTEYWLVRAPKRLGAPTRGDFYSD